MRGAIILIYDDGVARILNKDGPKSDIRNNPAYLVAQVLILTPLSVLEKLQCFTLTLVTAPSLGSPPMLPIPIPWPGPLEI